MNFFQQEKADWAELTYFVTLYWTRSAAWTREQGRRKCWSVAFRHLLNQTFWFFFFRFTCVLSWESLRFCFETLKGFRAKSQNKSCLVQSPTPKTPKKPNFPVFWNFPQLWKSVVPPGLLSPLPHSKKVDHLLATHRSWRKWSMEGLRDLTMASERCRGRPRTRALISCSDSKY